MPQETVKKIDLIELEVLEKVADALQEMYYAMQDYDYDSTKLTTEGGRLQMAHENGQRSVVRDIRGVINARRHRLKE